MSNKRKTYTEEEISEFISLAQELGIARSIRELKYPTFKTAKRWAEMRGVSLELNQLSQFANDMKQYYTLEEKLFVLQLQLDRIQEALQEDDLDPDALKKLSEASKRTIETLNLIENKATAINESRTYDQMDANIQAMIAEQEHMNEIKAASLNERDD
jgi:hypothetical protein